MIKSLSELDPNKYRSIIFHGKNSMTDMNLMMIGSTPLSNVKPKNVEEEIAYTDGDLDLSNVDGKIYFNSREITYTFISVYDYFAGTVGDINNDGYVDGYDRRLLDDHLTSRKPLTGERLSKADLNSDGNIDVTDASILAGKFNNYNSTVYKNRAITDFTSNLYEWLYLDNSEYKLGKDTISKTDLYDYAYGDYKFIKARVTDVQTGKGIFNSVWVEQVSVTFKFYPYMQTLHGEIIDIAEFVDRSVTDRDWQTAMMVFTNNRYFLNDYLLWANDLVSNDGGNTNTKKWKYVLPVPYTGPIGIFLERTPIFNGVSYPVTEITGSPTLSFYDNNHETAFSSANSGYAIVTPIIDSYFGPCVTLNYTFENTYNPDNKPVIYIEWGVLRSFNVPDQENYIMESHSKSSRAQMYVNGSITPLNQKFSLPTQPLNEIHIRNTDYDGLYKLKYETAERRL